MTKEDLIDCELEEEEPELPPEKQQEVDELVAKFIHGRLSYRQRKEMQHA